VGKLRVKKSEYTNNYELGHNTFVKQTSLSSPPFRQYNTGSIQASTTQRHVITRQNSNRKRLRRQRECQRCHVNIISNFAQRGTGRTTPPCFDNNSHPLRGSETKVAADGARPEIHCSGFQRRVAVVKQNEEVHLELKNSAKN
jgi:hypothetical protein